VSEFYMPLYRTNCSIFIEGVSRKNKQAEIVRVFIWEKVWLKRSLSQSDRLRLQNF